MANILFWQFSKILDFILFFFVFFGDAVTCWVCLFVESSCSQFSHCRGLWSPITDKKICYGTRCWIQTVKLEKWFSAKAIWCTQVWSEKSRGNRLWFVNSWLEGKRWRREQMNFFLDSSLKLSVSCDVHKEAGICVENVRKKNLKNKKKQPFII